MRQWFIDIGKAVLLVAVVYIVWVSIIFGIDFLRIEQYVGEWILFSLPIIFLAILFWADKSWFGHKATMIAIILLVLGILLSIVINIKKIDNRQRQHKLVKNLDI